MQLFANIMKVNVAERTVEGIIADETRDLSGEIFDYASSKPLFEAWSQNVSKATAGKNIGNVRVMHGTSVAGVTKAMEFLDSEKAIKVVAHIVDDNEWNKTLAGCYTGFSIGGKYEKKWDTADGKRYTANPSEYSLVDLPCNPNASFTVVKADGTEDMVKFAPETPQDDVAVQAMLKALQLRDDALLEKTRLSQEDAMTEDLKKKADDAVAAAAAANDALAKSTSDLQKMTAARDDLQKSHDALQKSLDEANAAIASGNEDMVKAAARLDEQGALLAKFAAAPAPVRAALTAIAKSADVPSGAQEPEPVMEADGTTVNKAATALRHALANPIVVR